MKRFRVKVCGITRPGDAALAAELGADLIGIIFHPGSPRAVTVRQGERICAKLPPVVQLIGVFVNESPDDIIALARRLRLDFVQLHGHPTEKDIRRIRAAGLRVIKAIHGSASRVPKSAADLIMFDNLSRGHHGGTGQTFTWPIHPRRDIPNLMLAGGLNEENLEDGVRLFNPMIVDVNSGVESSPGIKSRTRLSRFMQVCDRIRYGY